MLKSKGEKGCEGLVHLGNEVIGAVLGRKRAKRKGVAVGI